MSDAHPPDETLAAFVDGRLPNEEVRLLARHLSTCVECLLILKAVAQLESEEFSPRRPRASWWLAAAAAFAGTLVVPLWQGSRHDDTRPIELRSDAYR